MSQDNASDGSVLGDASLLVPQTSASAASLRRLPLRRLHQLVARGANGPNRQRPHGAGQPPCPWHGFYPCPWACLCRLCSWPCPCRTCLSPSGSGLRLSGWRESPAAASAEIAAFREQVAAAANANAAWLPASPRSQHDAEPPLQRPGQASRGLRRHPGSASPNVAVPARPVRTTGWPLQATGLNA